MTSYNMKGGLIFISLLCIFMSHTMSFEDFAEPLYDGSRYSNPKSFTNWTGIPGFGSLIKWKVCETDKSGVPNDEEKLNHTVPVHTLEKFESKAPLYAAWLGHATVLVGLDGAKFITDPVWTQRASPVSFAGPARYRPPPMLIQNLPQLDFAFISHDHYDHLDLEAVKKINEQCPSMTWFVPKGMKSWMRDTGIDNVVELNWGKHHEITVRESKYTIWCVPAQHWGQRGPGDRNKRLWSGWVVEGPSKKFYYSGDTGFCEKEFKKIGDRLGPIDLCAIPIGCYEPKWFMKSQHIGPEEAVGIHEMVKSRFSIGIHWGTYHMGSYEHYLAPKEELKKLMDGRSDLNPFVTIEMGKIWEETASETSKTDQTTDDSPKM